MLAHVVAGTCWGLGGEEREKIDVVLSHLPRAPSAPFMPLTFHPGGTPGGTGGGDPPVGGGKPKIPKTQFLGIFWVFSSITPFIA